MDIIDSGLTWELISTEHIIQDRFIDFRRSAYRLPNGTVCEPFYHYSRRDYVVIVATDEEGRYICVRQYRPGIGEVTTEFPAGGIERNDGRQYAGSTRRAETDAFAEAALDTAKRELLEETGYTSDDWTHLLTVPSNAVISDNYAVVFAARNCRRTGTQDLDDTEFLNVVTHSEDEIEQLVYTGGFQQSVHVMAWMLSKKEAGCPKCERTDI